MEKYVVIEDIGKGSYGSVQKIQRKDDPKKFYCWKEINYGHLQEKQRAQIVSEINCLSKLNHNNIVKYIEEIVDREQKKIYIVMEYCENGDMAQLIKKCKAEKDFVAEDVIWKIFMQILLALRECHYRGIKGSKILHRDLKPSNVFFDCNNNVKLGDFGLSRIIKNESGDNDAEAFASTNVGTPYYMSPEQIHENQYDEKTDIWSTGCVIYELVSLLPPFTAGNHLALAQKIIAGRIERIPERYSEDLFEVIQSMLKVNPKERPTVEDLIKLPKIKLRINERKMRDQYSKLKYKEQKLNKKENELRKKEEALKKREKEQNEKDQLVRDMYNNLQHKLKMRQAKQQKSQPVFSANQIKNKISKNNVFNSQNNNSNFVNNISPSQSFSAIKGPNDETSISQSYNPLMMSSINNQYTGLQSSQNTSASATDLKLQSLRSLGNIQNPVEYQQSSQQNQNLKFSNNY